MPHSLFGPCACVIQWTKIHRLKPVLLKAIRDE